MIPNDQLTRNERIRLESLSQSIQATAITSSNRPTLSDILANAEKIEVWLKSVKDN